MGDLVSRGLPDLTHADDPLERREEDAVAVATPLDHPDHALDPDNHRICSLIAKVSIMFGHLLPD